MSSRGWRPRSSFGSTGCSCSSQSGGCRSTGCAWSPPRPSRSMCAPRPTSSECSSPTSYQHLLVLLQARSRRQAQPTSYRHADHAQPVLLQPPLLLRTVESESVSCRSTQSFRTIASESLESDTPNFLSPRGLLQAGCDQAGQPPAQAGQVGPHPGQDSTVHGRVVETRVRDYSVG